MSEPKIIIRKATQDDLDEILEIYSYAREFMRKTGNPTQWYGHYPPKSVLENDITKQQLYVCVADGVCAVFMMHKGPDKTYAVIENGNWPNQNEYGVIHRIASNGKQKGILKVCIDFCKNFYSDIRIDTHQNNKIMQHLLEKNGFCRCGIIYTESGEERIAYQYSKAQA